MKKGEKKIEILMKVLRIKCCSVKTIKPQLKKVLGNKVITVFEKIDSTE